MKRPRKIIVIGAGAAGLYAARDLSRERYDTTVIEARDRIGGRIYTLREAFCPVPIELGAEFVHGKSPELFELVHQANLLLYDVTERHWFIREGELIKSREFHEKLVDMLDQMKTRRTDESFQEFLDSFPDDLKSRITKSIATEFIEGFHAASLRTIGVNGLVRINEESEKIEGDRSFRVLNGYHQVIDYLYRELISHGGNIHFNTVVKEICWEHHQVKVITQSGDRSTTFEADQAIITLPIGVLQARPDEEGAVLFVPELPKAKRDAIEQIVMGNVLKIILVFQDRFWEHLTRGSGGEKVDFSEMAFMHNTEAWFPTWWSQLPVRSPLLVGWIGGPSALVDVDGNNILDHAMSSLAELLRLKPEEIRELLVSYFVHDWHSDPFSRGAYTYLPVDGLEAQHTLMKTVDDTLFFAGEATAVGHVGTVHGAIVSAERVIGEVLKS